MKLILDPPDPPERSSGWDYTAPAQDQVGSIQIIRSDAPACTSQDDAGKRREMKFCDSNNSFTPSKSFNIQRQICSVKFSHAEY